MRINHSDSFFIYVVLTSSALIYALEIWLINSLFSLGDTSDHWLGDRVISRHTTLFFRLGTHRAQIGQKIEKINTLCVSQVWDVQKVSLEPQITVKPATFATSDIGTVRAFLRTYRARKLVARIPDAKVPVAKVLDAKVLDAKAPDARKPDITINAQLIRKQKALDALRKQRDQSENAEIARINALLTQKRPSSR